MAYDGNLIFVHGQVTSQFAITVNISVKGHPVCWNLSGIYTSPRRQERDPLWVHLIEVATDREVPTLIVVDYNLIRSSEEKQGGNRVSLSQIQELDQMLEKGGLE